MIHMCKCKFNLLSRRPRTWSINLSPVQRTSIVRLSFRLVVLCFRFKIIKLETKSSASMSIGRAASKPISRHCTQTTRPRGAWPARQLGSTHLIVVASDCPTRFEIDPFRKLWKTERRAAHSNIRWRLFSCRSVWVCTTRSRYENVLEIQINLHLVFVMKVSRRRKFLFWFVL